MSPASPAASQPLPSFRFLPRYVRTPTVLQMEAVECGAAALAMIMAYFGRWVPLEQLRSECGVSRNGVNALRVLKVAQQYGFKTRAVKRSAEQLGDLKLPFMVFWNNDHFLVVEGFGRNSVRLNDPAAGRRRVTRRDFNRLYSGAAFTFTRTKEFKKGGHPRSTIKALAARLKGSGLGLLYVSLASLALVIPGLMIPCFMRIFVDEILIKGNHRWILGLLCAMVGTALLKSALTWMKQYFLMRLETRMSLSTTGRFLWHVMRLPVEFFGQRYGGEIASRVTLNDSLASLVGGQLAEATLNVLMVGIYGYVMFLFDDVLAWMVIALAVMNFVTLIFTSRFRQDCSARLQQETGKVMGATTGGLMIMDTLKATGRESDFFVRWAGFEAKLVNATQEVGFTSQMMGIMPTTVTSLMNLAILCVGGLRVMHGQMSLGMLLAFQTLSGSFLDPFNGLVGYGSSLQEVRSDVNRLDDVLRYQPAIPSHEVTTAGATGQRLAGALELRNVTFGYSKLDPPLVSEFSLFMEPGARVALVGGTGSGKSTIAKLVTGLVEPWSGDILFDGKPRSEYARSIITSSLALVDQDVHLFSGTFRDNLTLWDHLITDDAVKSAAKDASILELIMSRPAGLDSELGEGGKNLSGGERQRLEIARALVGDPTILVLDEATSALDPLVEKTIDDRLKARGCTCLIVAHRLSTVRDCDEIIVLEKGQVVQRGTHDELAGVQGPYRRLVDAELAAAAKSTQEVEA